MMKNKILLLFVLLIPSLGFGKSIKFQFIVDEVGDDLGGMVTILFQDGKAEGIYSFIFEKKDNLPLTTQKSVYKEYLAYLMLRYPS